MKKLNTNRAVINGAHETNNLTLTNNAMKKTGLNSNSV
jgi:hypothetical protein